MLEKQNLKKSIQKKLNFYYFYFKFRINIFRFAKIQKGNRKSSLKLPKVFQNILISIVIQRYKKYVNLILMFILV